MRFSRRAKKAKASEIRELLKLTQKKGIISFGGGLPSPHSFPYKYIERIAKNVLERDAKHALQYGPTEGLDPLRKAIAKRMKKFGVRTKKDNILITSGSQQGLDLTGKIFLDPGDVVALELPSYLGAIQAFNNYECKYDGIKLHKDGLDTNELEKYLRSGRKPKFLYTVPTFQNPTGITMSLEKRKHLIEIANKYDLVIIDDEPYTELRYSGKNLPSLRSLDKEDRVVFLGTFSKILCPGFRLAWVNADEEIIQKLVIAKQGTDLCSNMFVQYIALDYMKVVDRHIRFIKRLYKHKRNLMLNSLERHLTGLADWTKPEGGLFLWLMLHERINTKEMLPEALRAKVAYVSGSSFFVNGSGKNTMRLNFSNAENDDIETGIARLAKVIKKSGI